MGSFKLHEEMKQMLMQDPSKLGLNEEDIREIREEVPIVGEKEALIAQPDLVVEKKSGEKVFVEVKSGCHWRARNRLMCQMIKLKKYIKRNKLRAAVLGVYLSRNRSLVLMSM